jgi:hypothetical protein
MTHGKNKVWALVMAGLAASFSGMTSAAETATGTISQSSLGGGEFQYNLSVTNTSTDGSDIGTFWYSWIPGKDFMEVKPTNITFPSGWSVNITGTNNASDGNALQFLAGAGPLLTPGNTDDFSFDSTETLAQMTGPSPFLSSDIETTSFVYHAAPFSDAGDQFTLTPVTVPEPVSASMLALFGGGLLMRRRRA